MGLHGRCLTQLPRRPRTVHGTWGICLHQDGGHKSLRQRRPCGTERFDPGCRWRRPAARHEAVPDTPCDILAPCALGATLNKNTIPRLACKAVAGSANNQLETTEDADRLHQRGILYAPDYVVNAGGAIAFGMMHRGQTAEDDINNRIIGIAKSLEEILEYAEEHGESPVYGANRKVERVLARHKQAGAGV